MIVKIGLDDRYPDFFITESNERYKADISEGKIKEWKKIIKAYEVMQEEIRKLVSWYEEEE